MSTSISWNGSNYTIPAVGDRLWGQNVTNYLIAIASGALSKAGGNFTLTADVNFGATYGLVSSYFKSRSSNIAASGVIRLANTDKVAFRNNANGADLSLGVSTSDRLQFESVNIPTISSTDTLTNKTIVAANNTITTASTGNLAATELNAALAELQTDIDTRATSSTVTAHTGASTGVHGVTGSVVGTSDSQTLTNKTLDAAIIDNGLTMLHETTPSTPSSGRVRVYPKSDNSLYVLDPNGVETQVGSGSGQGEKNYITNPSMKSATTGWNNVGDLDVARTTTASELPREYTTGTGLKITADSNTQSTADYVYYDFTLDDVDLNRKLVIKWSQKQTGSYAAGNLAVVITTQADRTTALHTPETTAIPAADGDFQTTFDAGSTATLSLVIRATTDMTTDAGIVISDVVVGPGVIGSVPAVGEPVTFTPTGSWVSNTTYTGKYWRIGSRAHFEVNVALTGAPTSATLTINLPSGLTIDSSSIGTTQYKYNYGAGTGYKSPTASNLIVLSNGTTSDVVASYQSAVTGAISLVNATAPSTWASGDSISLRFQVPIAEWAGSVSTGPVPVEEFAASTTGTWDAAAGSANTVRTPDGAPISGSLTTGRTKRVQFQYPIQADDELVLEVKLANGYWVPISQTLGNYFTTASVEFGARLVGVSGSTTEVDVLFNQYIAIGSSLTATTGAVNWSTSYATAWRVRKTKKASLPFANAGTNGSAGLYKAGQAPGLTTGATIGAGYVGETVTWSSAPSTQVLTTSVADWTNASITLTPGVWQISANITVQVATGTTAANNTTGVAYVTDSSNNVIQNMESGIAATTAAAASTLVTGMLAFSAVVNISSSTTYKIRGIRIDGAGTGSAQLRNQGASYSRFYAVRIA